MNLAGVSTYRCGSVGAADERFFSQTAISLCIRSMLSSLDGITRGCTVKLSTTPGIAPYACLTTSELLLETQTLTSIPREQR